MYLKVKKKKKGLKVCCQIPERVDRNWGPAAVRCHFIVNMWVQAELWHYCVLQLFNLSCFRSLLTLPLWKTLNLDWKILHTCGWKLQIHFLILLWAWFQPLLLHQRQLIWHKVHNCINLYCGRLSISLSLFAGKTKQTQNLKMHFLCQIINENLACFFSLQCFFPWINTH